MCLWSLDFYFLNFILSGLIKKIRKWKENTQIFSVLSSCWLWWYSCLCSSCRFFLEFSIVSGLVLLLMSLHLGDLIIMSSPMMNHFPLNRGIFLYFKVEYFFEIGLFFWGILLYWRSFILVGNMVRKQVLVILMVVFFLWWAGLLFASSFGG